MLPAYAGMIPLDMGSGDYIKGAPRVCGDDPIADMSIRDVDVCSPRMRG